jgi:hypothetical protein
VKTDKLQPQDATTWGTFQIQRPGGQGVIAAGENHGGDTDWTQVAIYFESPGDGRVGVAAFFAGVGKGTGTAWFDDLALEPVDFSREPIRVTRKPLNGDAEISPYQYGQFIEYLCNSFPPSRTASPIGSASVSSRDSWQCRRTSPGISLSPAFAR